MKLLPWLSFFPSLLLLAPRADAQAAATSVPLTSTADAVVGPDARHVLVVEPGGPPGTFLSLQTAVQEAREGDVVLVKKTANYGRITIDAKSVHVVADAGVRIWIQPQLVVRNLGPEQRVIVRGADLRRNLAGSLFYGTSNLRVEDNEGLVWLEDCTIEAFDPLIPVYGAAEPAVEVLEAEPRPTGVTLFVRTSIEGSRGMIHPMVGGTMHPSTAVVVEKAVVSFWDCAVRGGRGGGAHAYMPLPGGDGSPALVAVDAHVFASGSTFEGGAGGAGSGAQTCTDGGTGGAGIHLEGATTVARLLDTRRVGGTGGTGGAAPGCVDGSDGSSDLVFGAALAVEPGAAHSLLVPTPLRNGSYVNALASGTAGTPFAVFLDRDAVFFGTIPQVSGARVVMGSPSGNDYGTLDKSGSDIRHWYVTRGVKPGQQAGVYFLQALFLDFQTFPGIVLGIFGAPTAAVVVDHGI